jgi:hypothetical protein
MQPRDIFDGVLLALLCVLSYLEIFGFTFSTERVRTVVETLLNIDLAIYLVVAGVLTVAYLVYILIYLPGKQGQSPEIEG